MDLAKTINEAKDSVLLKNINRKKISKALSLIKDEIVVLAKSGVSIEEQSEILSEALKLNINHNTYKSFYYRNIKSLLTEDTKITLVKKKESSEVALENEPKIEKKSKQTAEEIFNKTVNIESDLAKLV